MSLKQSFWYWLQKAHSSVRANMLLIFSSKQLNIVVSFECSLWKKKLFGYNLLKDDLFLRQFGKIYRHDFMQAPSNDKLVSFDGNGCPDAGIFHK